MAVTDSGVTRRLLVLLPGPRSPRSVILTDQLSRVTGISGSQISAVLEAHPEVVRVVGRDGCSGRDVEGWRRVR